MERIYIGFSKNTKSILSKTIQSIENSEYSHVYIRRISKYGEYVYQASGLQVNFMNIDIFKKHNKIIEEYEFLLPDNKKESIISFFMKYAGSTYSVKSLFKILTILIFDKIGIKINLKGDGSETFICSELGAFFYETILNLPIEDVIDFITPKKLNSIIKNNGIRVI